jgi:arylsulfatase A
MKTRFANFILTFFILSQVGGRPPNVVIMFMDDLGYADIGPFGATNFPTPNLDQMAKEGRKFTDFYVTQAVCSASRAGLLTGCYNVRIGILGALSPKSKTGLNPDETTIAEICKQQGYATACFGKWHLGHHKKFLPLQHGFDEFFGLPYSNDMWPYHPGVSHLPLEKRVKRWPHLPLIEGNKVINPKVTGKDQELLTKQYTERAVSFIKKNKDMPFFVYLPHSMVHVPLYVSEAFKGKSGAGLFGDVIMEVDWSVGEIMKVLRQNNLDENTLFIFTSDNGPWLNYGDHAGSAGPLREGKGTMFDGGCREPMIAWWPGTVPANSVCKEPAMTIDILPTIAKLSGSVLPDRELDGKNIWPLFIDDQARSPQEAYYLYYGDQLQAVRQGKWKLHFPHGYRTMAGKPGGTGGIPKNYSKGQIELSLFDLHQDIGESINMEKQKPEITRKLSKLAKDFDKKMNLSKRPAGRI